MFAYERQQRLKQMLFEQKHMDVATMSEILSVSEVTIRRDLDKLEKSGYLMKTHGGAVLNEEHIWEEAPRDFQDSPFNEDKIQIGRMAARLVVNDDAIFLGGGDTCLCIARSLKGLKRITVVTNDIAVAEELSALRGANIVLCGGELIENSTSTGGHLACVFFDHICVNKAFIPVKGIDMVQGYTTYSQANSILYGYVFSKTQEKIIVADASKFDRVSFSKIAPVEQATTIVTNKEMPSVYKDFYFLRNIRIYTNYEI